MNFLLYIGPGLGIGTLVIIAIVLLIVFVSLGLIIWLPLKKAIIKIIKYLGK